MNVNYSGASESSLPLDPLDRTESDEGLAFGPNDVLSGRNKLSFNHIGNRRFREVVAQSIDDYNSAHSRAEKYGIVETIMSHIAKSGGRFLKQAEGGNWQELEPETVRQKIAHAIRDTTKKRDAKLKKASQREAAAKLPQRVASYAHHPMDVGGVPPATSSRQQSRQSAPAINELLQGLNKHMQQVAPQGATSEGLSLPTSLKNLKQPAKLPPARHRLGSERPHPRNELRPDPEGLRPTSSHEMRRDLGHRIRPGFGPDQTLSLSERIRPSTAMGLQGRPGLHGTDTALGSRESLVPRQLSLPDLRVAQEQGLANQTEFTPFGMVTSQPPRQPEDPPVAHDDEFMAKIDDTLGPPEPEPPEPDPNFP